jgi:hypothetical protein
MGPGKQSDLSGRIKPHGGIVNVFFELVHHVAFLPFHLGSSTTREVSICSTLKISSLKLGDSSAKTSGGETSNRKVNRFPSFLVKNTTVGPGLQRYAYPDLAHLIRMIIGFETCE